TASHVEKVRSHMFNMDVRQHEQHDEELMREAARHISIHVNGEASGAANMMTIVFTTENPTVVLLRAELKNDVGATFGRAECVQQGSQEFAAELRRSDIQKWYDLATKHDMRGRRVLTIRTELQSGQQYLDRDIATWVGKS